MLVIVGDSSVTPDDVLPAVHVLASDPAVRQIDLDGGPHRLVIEIEGTHEQHAARLGDLVRDALGDDVTVVSP